MASPSPKRTAVLAFIRERIEEGPAAEPGRDRPGLRFRLGHRSEETCAGAGRWRPDRTGAEPAARHPPGRRAAPGELVSLPVLGRVAAGVPIGADIVRGRSAAATRSPSVLASARLPAQGAGRFDDRRRHPRRRPGRRASQQRSARWPGGGGAGRRRNHHQAPASAVATASACCRAIPRIRPSWSSRGQDFAIEGIFCGLIRQG